MEGFIRNEMASLRRRVLDIMIKVEEKYGTTDTEKLEKLMSPKEWELYCLLNTIENNLCV